MEAKKYIMLKEEYLHLVLSGKKSITIRRRTRLREGDLFYVHSGGKVWAVGVVTRVEKIRKSQITPEHARLEGMSYEKLLRELNRLYGRGDVPLVVVHFKLLEVFDRPFSVEDKLYGGRSPQEIARLALEHRLDLDEEAGRILREVASGKSIREVARGLGGLSKRRKVRAILRKAFEELKKKGIVTS